MSIQTIPVEEARNLLNCAKNALAELIQTTVSDVYGVEFTIAEVLKEFSSPKPEFGDVSIAGFNFTKIIKQKKPEENAALNPNAFATRLTQELTERTPTATQKALFANGKSVIKTIKTVGGYVNAMFTIGFHSQVLSSIAMGEFQSRVSGVPMDKVMIEYSQPNTHKAFHVGHMRNAALGDCLVRMYEQVGHEVIAVNYFGDEGAHVAKCLWYLQKVYLPKAMEAYKNGIAYDPTDKDSVYPMKDVNDIDVVPVEERAEWLGDLYTKAVDLLDLSLHTTLPFPMVISATVLSKEKHPNAEAPEHWHVCTLDIGSGKQATVVCGGMDYEVGDSIAYLPVGAKLTKKMGLIEPKDMMGVSSVGVMLAEKELGMNDEEEAAADKKKKKDKGSSATSALTSNNKIFKLPHGTVAGVNLADLGKVPEFVGSSVMEVYNALKKEAADVLLSLESGDAQAVALWHKTGQWSLDEFAKIYKWLDCRFDHNFTESEVSEPSRELVHKWLDKGFLCYDRGAVVCDLTQFNLGKCVLLKSDGAGLYATKDLALASRKFDQFGVDKSIYIVDAAQTYHFQQVFKTLEVAGYEQAKKCLHLPYGIVVLPSGRMSSRKGNVQLFSQLKRALISTLVEKYNDINSVACQSVAVAAIKYGMLNHDTSRDIVFEMDKWTQNTGNTGPYLLYAYSRTMSIFTIRENFDGVKFDIVSLFKKLGLYSEELFTKFDNNGYFDFLAFLQSPESASFAAVIDYDAYLTEAVERNVMLHIHKFWPVVQSVVESNNPSQLCDYVFNLAQLFSSWYEIVRLNAIEPQAVPTKLMLMKSVAEIVKKCMNLLGCNVVNKM